MHIRKIGHRTHTQFSSGSYAGMLLFRCQNFCCSNYYPCHKLDCRPNSYADSLCYYRQCNCHQGKLSSKFQCILVWIETISLWVLQYKYWLACWMVSFDGKKFFVIEVGRIDQSTHYSCTKLFTQKRKRINRLIHCRECSSGFRQYG